MTPAPFWSPAEARPQLWRTILGFVLLAAVHLAAVFAVVALVAPALGIGPGEVIGSATPGPALLTFVPFLGLHVGLVVVLRLLHERGYRSLFGPALRLNLRHLAYGFAVTFGIAVVGFVLTLIEQTYFPQAMRPELVRVNPTALWLTALVPAVVLIFMQSFAEELVFRGYLLQQLRARFRTPLVWAVLPALAFGAAHINPATFGANTWLIAINTALMALLATLVTMRTGNLGAAVGLHVGNNLSLVMIGVEGNISGLSLFAIRVDLAGSYMTYSVVWQTMVFLAIFLIWRRRMVRAERRAARG